MITIILGRDRDRWRQAVIQIRRCPRILLSFAFAMAATATAAARGDMMFVANLSADQEVPPRSSTATGFGTFLLNDSETELSFDISFSGLSSGASALHFHNAPFGSNGRVVRGIAIQAGVTSGNITGSWLSTDGMPLTSFLVDELKAGRIYVNLHTTTFPGGEIRGQLAAVPEPASLGLVAGGMALCGVYRRRRAGRKS